MPYIVVVTVLISRIFMGDDASLEDDGWTCHVIATEDEIRHTTTQHDAAFCCDGEVLRLDTSETKRTRRASKP